MGRHLQVEWLESIEELNQLYKAQKHPQRRTRLQVLGNCGKVMGKLDFERIQLPSYSPELNPTEHNFEEVRREMEGIAHSSFIAKQK